VNTKIKPLVNLNVNPCKMCMPMGAVTALYGIKNCISILHGSQGCATYIRRHMATHYNEPVDIASSSLTEQGTVYGGEANLKKGLKNLIDLYHPEVIGVATTCLAETIGEDISGMIDHFKEENPEFNKIEIIPVHSAGYAGSQYEGYFTSLTSIVRYLATDALPNNKINIITSQISPADTRLIKKVCGMFGMDIILLPDLSETLDGGLKKKYSRLPEGGTEIREIRKMAGAKYTIELCNLDMEETPGKYLNDTFQIPYVRLNLPTGLRDTDELLKVFSKISGRQVPTELIEQRQRYLDAMIDGHKYNADGRAVIYGTPDFVISAVRLCAENGIMPLVTATGSKCSSLKEIILPEIRSVAERYHISEYSVLDDADFVNIETAAKKLEANLMIGNSDGRRMEAELSIPLVRRGFPIHDRVGGQRLSMLFYDGTLTLLDEISNAVLGRTEESFRKNLYLKYYKGKEVAVPTKKTTQMSIEEKTKTHPCYNCAGHKYARMHLPVAPACNIQCNYCVRKFDCPNESRPGVTTQILTPQEAFEKYKVVKEKFPNLTVVGIAGPGDALANFEETKKSLQLIREFDPDVTFCLSTNGLMLPVYAKELIDLGVTHVTVTMNAVDPKIGARIYKHIYYMGSKYEGETAATILLSNQLAGLNILTAYGVICKVNIVTLKGINDEHIPEVVKKAKEIGCYITNIMPMIPVSGSAFEHNPVASNKEIEKIREVCGDIMKQMTHCKQCRADAIGTLDQDQSLSFRGYQPDPEKKKLPKKRFAVASHSGMIVDEHFGQVTEWHIYEYRKGEAVFIEKRNVEKYCQGSEECGEGEERIKWIIKAIDDCDGVICMRIGESPGNQLKQNGTFIFVTYDKIEEAVKKAGNEICKESEQSINKTVS